MAASKICMNVSCGTSNTLEWKNGWPLPTGGFALLCFNCGAAYEKLVFCDTFHLGETGWQDCSLCYKAKKAGSVTEEESEGNPDHGRTPKIPREGGASQKPRKKKQKVLATCDDASRQKDLPPETEEERKRVQLALESTSLGSPVARKSPCQSHPPILEGGSVNHTGSLKMVPDSLVDLKIDMNVPVKVDHTAFLKRVADSLDVPVLESTFNLCLRAAYSLFLLDESDASLRAQLEKAEDVIREKEQALKDAAAREKDLETTLSIVQQEVERIPQLEEAIRVYNEEAAPLKDKVAALKKQVANLNAQLEEEKTKSSSAVEAFKKSTEIQVILHERYTAGGMGCFNTMMENGWLNEEKMHADLDAEAGGITKEQVMVETDKESENEEEEEVTELQNKTKKISGLLNSTIVPLFEKVLTVSDVGRLVLPKACAEAYFPPITQSEGLPLRIQDVRGNEWTFQFRFWANNDSRMYVLEGVTPCIQSMGLQAGDTVTFSQIDPGNKIVIGFGKASKSVKMQEPQTSILPNSTPGGTSSSIVAGTLATASDDSSSFQTNKGSKNPLLNTPSNKDFAVCNTYLQRKDNNSEDMLQQPLPNSGKKRGRNIEPQNKRGLLHSEDVVEQMVTREEAQYFLHPPPRVKPSIVTIEDHEFEEYKDPPVYGKISVFSAGPSKVSNKQQQVQLESAIVSRVQQVNPQPVQPDIGPSKK